MNKLQKIVHLSTNQSSVWERCLTHNTPKHFTERQFHHTTYTVLLFFKQTPGYSKRVLWRVNFGVPPGAVMSYQGDHSLDHDKPGIKSERILNDKNFIVVKHWITVKIVHYRRPIN